MWYLLTIRKSAKGVKALCAIQQAFQLNIDYSLKTVWHVYLSEVDALPVIESISELNIMKVKVINL